MIGGLTLLLALQLVGEAAVRGLGLPVPGPVAGMALALAAFAALPRLRAAAAPAAEAILGRLGLLFVPAGVGVVGHLGRLGADVWPLLAAVALSTLLAIAAGAAVFGWTARAIGLAEEHEADGG